MTSPLDAVKNVLKRSPLVRKLHGSLVPKHDDVGAFIKSFFESPEQKFVVQVGANDGVMSDPLRPYLTEPGNYRAVLVEPLPFYVERLRALYAGRADIEIVHAAVGAQESEQDIFFMPPELADRMNGDGPQNNWAHGQGSFDRQSVVYWIEKNSFRGKEYQSQIPHFIESIASMKVPVITASRLLPDASNVLLVIDVQGFEMDVLKGVDWTRAPHFVIYEDDKGSDMAIASFLEKRGYTYVCGKTDKVYRRG